MSSLAVRVVSDDTMRTIAECRKRFGGAVLHQALGKALLDCVQGHFRRRNLEPNRWGFPKTGFWEQAAKGSSFTSTEHDATVIMPYPLKQKYYGGTINARPGSALAIPVHAKSYGKMARDMRQDGLTQMIRFGGKGGTKAVGIIVEKLNGKPVGDVLFVLVMSVTQQKDTRTLPSDEELTAAAYAGVEREADAVLSEN